MCTFCCKSGGRSTRLRLRPIDGCELLLQCRRNTTPISPQTGPSSLAGVRASHSLLQSPVVFSGSASWCGFRASPAARGKDRVPGGRRRCGRRRAETFGSALFASSLSGGDAIVSAGVPDLFFRGVCAAPATKPAGCTSRASSVGRASVQRRPEPLVARRSLRGDLVAGKAGCLRVCCPLCRAPNAMGGVYERKEARTHRR